MTSHEYAKTLADVAELLNDSPEFELPSYYNTWGQHITVRFYGDKEQFLAAVRAVGRGEKVYTDECGTPILEFLTPAGLALQIERDKVCRIVKPAQPAEYDCESLLSKEEEAQVGA